MVFDEAAAVYFASRLRRRGINAKAVKGRLYVAECLEELKSVPIIEVHCSSSS